MTAISRIVRTKVDSLSLSSQGSYGLLEAIESLLNDYMSIDDPEMSNRLATFPHVWADPTTNEPVVTTVCVRLGDYQQCLAGLADEIQIIYADGTTETVGFDGVDQEFRDYVSDLQVQAVFLKACLYPDDLSLGERFRLEVQSRAPGAAPHVIENYALAFENTTEPAQALANYYSMGDQSSIDHNDPYLNFSNIREYQGSIWGYAIGKVGDAALSFWDYVKSAVATTAAFLATTVNGIVQGISYLGKRYVEPYLSPYQVVGEGDGTMDLPLFQTIIPKSASREWIDALIATFMGTSLVKYTYPCNGNAYRMVLTYDKVVDLLERATTVAVEKVIDGTTYRQGTEVLISTGDSTSSSFSVRLNRTLVDGEECIIVQLLAAPNAEDAATLVEDPEGDGVWAWRTFRDAVPMLYSLSPTNTSPQRVDDTSIDRTDKADAWLSSPYVDGTTRKRLINMLDSVGAHNSLLTVEDIANNGLQVQKLLQLLIYVNIISKAMHQGDVSAFNDWMTSLYEPYDPGEYSDIVNAVEAYNLLDFSYDTFRPYAHTRILPVRVHARTVAELANQVYKIGIAAFIAVATVLLAVKIRSFRLRRRSESFRKTEAARLAAATAISNPTTDNIADYNRAYSSLQRTSKWNAALGIQNVGMLGIETTASVGVLDTILNNKTANQLEDGFGDLTDLIR